MYCYIYNKVWPLPWTLFDLGLVRLEVAPGYSWYTAQRHWDDP